MHSNLSANSPCTTSSRRVSRNWRWKWHSKPLKPTTVTPHFYNLGQAQLNAGNRKDAIDTFTNLTNRLPNSAPAWYRLAWAQRVSGDMNAALKSLQKSVRFDPTYLDARIALAGLYAVLGQQDNALKETRANQALIPSPPLGTTWKPNSRLASRTGSIPAGAGTRASNRTFGKYRRNLSSGHGARRHG